MSESSKSKKSKMSQKAEFKVNVSKHDWYKVLSSFPGAKADSSVVMFIEHVITGTTVNPAIFRLRARKNDKSDTDATRKHDKSDATVKVRRVDPLPVSPNADAKFEYDVQITHLGEEVSTDSLLPSGSLTVPVVDLDLKAILGKSNGEIAKNPTKLVNLFNDEHLKFAQNLLGVEVPRSSLRLITRKITEVEFELDEVPELGKKNVSLTHWRWGDEPDQETFEVSWKKDLASKDELLPAVNKFKIWLRYMDIAPRHYLPKTSTFMNSTTRSGL